MTESNETPTRQSIVDQAHESKSNEMGYGQHEVPDNPRDVASMLAGPRPQIDPMQMIEDNLAEGESKMIFTITARESVDGVNPANPQVGYQTLGDIQIMDACAALSGMWHQMIEQSMAMAARAGTPFESFSEASQAVTAELQRRQMIQDGKAPAATFEEHARANAEEAEQVQTLDVTHESAQDDLDYINGVTPEQDEKISADETRPNGTDENQTRDDA